jgi:endonuclease/exonuclease/phosphatase family metal-dependent hydrolase
VASCDLDAGDRNRQFFTSAAGAHTRRYDASTPIVLAGDLNLDASAGPASASISQAQFQDVFASHHVPTTPGSFLDPGRTIDWIFARGPIRASQPQVGRVVSASDHYPLSVTLRREASGTQAERCLFTP